MKKKISLIGMVVIILSICSLSFFSMAKEGNIVLNKPTVEGQKYSNLEFINAFIQSATSKHIKLGFPFPDFFPAYISGVSPEDSFYNPDYINEHYPWLYPLMSQNNGIPDYAAISRWAKPIRISLGLPNDGKPYNVPLYKNKLVTDYPEWPDVYYEKNVPDQPVELVFKSALLYPGYDIKKINLGAQKTVIEEVKKLSSAMANLTGLDVSFVEQEPDDPSLVSGMRIILIDPHSAKDWMTKFRRNVFVTNVGSGTHAHRAKGVSFMALSDRIDSAIFYTPVLGYYQVDGFYVVDDENEINFSVCYIRDDLDSDLLKKMVRECLVRSLGLPSPQKSIDNSVLTLWNSPHIDRDKLLAVRDNIMNTLDTDQAKISLLSNPVFMLSEISNINAYTNIRVSHFNEADEEFIQLLYSNSIRPGMKHTEVFKILYDLQQKGR